jgi:hypothetical protein
MGWRVNKLGILYGDPILVGFAQNTKLSCLLVCLFCCLFVCLLAIVELHDF